MINQESASHVGTGDLGYWLMPAVLQKAVHQRLDALDPYTPKQEIRFNLNTQDRRDPVRQAHIEFVRLNEEFQQIRQRLNTTPNSELSDEDPFGLG